jgi:hypothetical protein
MVGSKVCPPPVMVEEFLTKGWMNIKKIFFDVTKFGRFITLE